MSESIANSHSYNKETNSTTYGSDSIPSYLKENNKNKKVKLSRNIIPNKNSNFQSNFNSYNFNKNLLLNRKNLDDKSITPFTSFNKYNNNPKKIRTLSVIPTDINDNIYNNNNNIFNNNSNYLYNTISNSKINKINKNNNNYYSFNKNIKSFTISINKKHSNSLLLNNNINNIKDFNISTPSNKNSKKFSIISYNNKLENFESNSYINNTNNYNNNNKRKIYIPINNISFKDRNHIRSIPLKKVKLDTQLFEQGIKLYDTDEEKELRRIQKLKTKRGTYRLMSKKKSKKIKWRIIKFIRKKKK